MSALSRCRVSSAIGPTSEKEFFRSVPPVKMTSTAVPDNSADIHGVGNDREIVKVAKGTRNGCGGSAGIENHDLPFLHHACGRGRDLQLFLAVQLFFFTKRRILERPLAGR